MRLEDHYDWVVLGDHPAALLSASLVARLGLSVLILPLNTESKVVHGKIDGKVWDPEPNFWLGLGESGLLHDCLRRLGTSQAELQAIKSEGVGAQVLTPNQRILLQDQEWTREFGEGFDQATGLLSAFRSSEETVLSYWKNFPDRLTLVQTASSLNFEKKGFFRKKPKQTKEPQTVEQLRRGLKKQAKLKLNQAGDWFSGSKDITEIGKHFGNRNLQLAISGLLAANTQGSVASDLSFAEAMNLLILGKTGGTYRGGAAQYRSFLFRLARRLGAHIPAKTECRRLFVDSGRFVGVQVASRGNMISVRGGVLGTTLSAARAKMTFSGRNWFGGLKKSLAADGWRFTISIMVPQQAIPPGMQLRSVWQEEGAPPLEIEIMNLTEYGNARPEDRLIFLRTVIPFKEFTLEASYQQMTAARMLRQLIEICPFIEGQINYICPEFRPKTGQAASNFVELREIYPFDSLDMIPENLCVFSTSSSRRVGARSGIGGLFVASDESFPNLGSFGGSLAAIEASAWIAHRSGLTGPL